MEPIKIAALLGSLRAESFNKSLLDAAIKLCPADANITKLEIGNLPLFNQDQENNLPDVVRHLKEGIKSADAILFVTPEYNYSVPGVLKNAIDWASRPYTDNSFQGKPAAIISGSNGLLGGARAQYHLRQMFVFLDIHPINRPECIVNQITDKIVNGELTDQHTIDKIVELLSALVAWTRQIK